MSQRIAKLAGTMLAAGALAILPATTAQAAPKKAADSFYNLSITQLETGATSTSGLSCAPPSGSHPYAGRVCSQLAQANGFIELIPPVDGACPLIYDPVTVSATGFWNGEARSYESTFENRCVAIRDTGGYIFNF